ncbi:MAG: sulfatase [Chitinophagales bacterium]
MKRLPIVFTVLSVWLITLWQQVFRADGWLIAEHAVMALLLHTIFFSVVQGWLKSQRVKALVIALYAAVWTTFYQLIFLSAKFWGDIITLKIVITYLKSFADFIQSLPVAPAQAIFFLAAPPLLVAIGTYRLLKSRQTTTAGTSTWLLIVAVVVLVAVKRPLHRVGEPMMVFLFDKMWGWNNNPFFTLEKNKAGKADEAAYRQYLSVKQSCAKRNVILIVCDGLRADHTTPYGYTRNTTPFLQELIREKKAVAVEQVIASGASTVIGVPSLLLSRYWGGCSPYGFNLIKLLHAQGFQTHVLVSGAHRDWYNLAAFYQNDCDSYFDGKDSKKYYFKDDRVLEEGLAQVSVNRNQPQFFYFHIQSPHETALLRKDFEVYQPSKTSLIGNRDFTALKNAYDNKVLQADETIRQLFATLAQKGILQNALVVITADHGQGLGEHGVAGHVDWLYQPQVRVPLLIVDTGLAFYQNTQFARQIDIAPTLVNRLGLAVPATWQGQPLSLQPPPDVAFMETGSSGLEHGHSPLQAVIERSDSAMFKLIAGGGNEVLYEVKTDRDEQFPRQQQDTAVLHRLRNLLKRYIRGENLK